MIKIVHTADWHIGSFKGPVVYGKNMRLEDTKKCIEELISKVEREEPDAVLISGDIFNTSSAYESSGMPEVDVAYDYITMLSMVCPVIVMRGTPNHDGDERFDHLENILRSNPDAHVVSEPKVIVLPTAGGNQIYVAVVPGFDRGEYRAKCPGISKEEENAIFTQELSNIVLGLKSICSPEAVTVLMSHYTVPGCNMESGQVAFYHKSEPVLLQETLKAANYDLVALGHIHRPQLVDGTDNVYYAGAVNAFTFNDEGQERGFYIHHFDTEEKKALADSQFVTLPYREMYTIFLNNVDIKKLNSGEWESVAAIRWQGKIVNKIVRVFYECTKEDSKAFNKAILEKELVAAGAYWVSGIDMKNQIELQNHNELKDQTDPLANLQQYLLERGYEEHMLSDILKAAVPIIDKAMANGANVHVRGVMAPLSIKVCNYRNYREAEFDFKEITFCTINGENGAGKSSLFMDAIVDCLYEETREGEITGWISNHLDAKNGTIEFTFSIGEKIFRVFRTRSKVGRASLNISELVDGEWENRSEEKAKETQRKILEVIGMDSRTFRSCVLIMQDQYGIFMEAAKEERMKVFGDVLGLDIYVQMEADAKEHMKKIKSIIDENKTVLDLHYEELQEIGEPQLELKIEEEHLEEVQHKLLEVQPKRDGKAAELHQQEEYASFLIDRTNELEVISKKIIAAETEQQKLKDVMADCHEHLNNEDLICENVLVYQELQVKERNLAVLVKEYELKSETCRTLLEQQEAVEQALKTIVIDSERVQAQIEKKPILPIADIRLKVSAYKEKQSKHEALSARREEDRALREQTENCKAKLQSENARFAHEIELREAIIAGYSEQVEKMKDSDCLDVTKASCRFLLGAKEAEQKMNRDIQELETLKSEQKTVLQELQKQVDNSQKAITDYDFDLATFVKLGDELKESACCLGEYEKAKETEAEKSVLKEKLGALTTSLDEKKKELQVLDKDITAVQDELIALKSGYEEDSSIKSRMELLFPYLSMKETLPVYRERLLNTENALKTLECNWNELINEHEEKQNSVKQMEQKCIGIELIRKELQDLDDDISEHQNSMQCIQKAIGSLEEKIKKQTAIEMEIKKKEEQNVMLGKDLSIYEILKNAFGREGIPHNIIRSIIPNLTSAANNILGQMTGGKLGIDFVLDKQLKSGRDSVALDILIEEYGKGTLPYRSKSGGEKVKASLAAALALAEIKSRSLGIQSGMLFIDEPPFLDGDGIQAYVDALEVLQERYPDVKIMAITHDPTMKARFPQSIDVLKTENGSRIIQE